MRSTGIWIAMLAASLGTGCARSGVTRMGSTRPPRDANCELTLASQTPLPVAPAAPTGLTAAAIAQMQINLSWIDVTGETTYTLQLSTNGVNVTTIATLSGSIQNIYSAVAGVF